MKKYLSLAAVLGAVAFLSVSYLAQAQTPAAGATTTTTTTAAPAPAAAPDAVVTYAKDRAECDVLASAATTEGAMPTDADKAASVKKCLAGKGHSLDEVTKEEATRSAPVAPPAAVPAAK